MFARRVFARHFAFFDNAVTAARYRLLPALRQFLGHCRDTLAAEVEAAMRARTDTGILAIAPVKKIVPALFAGPGVIGDFVSRTSSRFRHLLCDLVKRCGVV